MIDIFNRTRLSDRHSRVPDWVLEAFQQRLDESSVANYVFCGRYTMYISAEPDGVETWRASIDCDTWDYWDTERDPTRQKDPITLDEFEIEKI